MMMTELEARCPCCRVPLQATVTALGVHLEMTGATPTWLRRLENLTPGGSEYVGDPANCVGAVEQHIRMLQTLLARARQGSHLHLPTECRSDALEWASVQAERAERVSRAARVLRRAQQYGGPLAQQAAALELERAARWSPLKEASDE